MGIQVPIADFRLSSRSIWIQERKKFYIKAFGVFAVLQLLFLAVICLEYGSQYKNKQRVYRLNLVAVDYDGGIIGQALLAAYNGLKGSSFPTLNFFKASDFPTSADLQESVCRGDYWAAIYTLPSASARLSQAIQGGVAAATYNASNTIQYIYNQARFTSAEQSFVKMNIEKLISASRVTYTHLNGTAALQSLNTSDANAVNAFLNPINAAAISLAPINQGTAIFYNSLSVAMAIMQQFLFAIAINEISEQLEFYTKLSAMTNGLIRTLLGLLYTLVGALCWAGYIWAFKEEWDIGAIQFVLIWMTSWLFMYTNFIVLDTMATLLPTKIVPFVMMLWTFLNLASSLAVFDLAPLFYRYGYAMPAYNWYTLFVQVVSGGCGNELKRALPVLFGWLAIGQLTLVPATIHRCRQAARKQENSRQSTTSDELSGLEHGSISGVGFEEIMAHSKNELEIVISTSKR